MKKQLSILALGIAITAPFSAFAEGAYVGVNAGRAHHKVNYADGESAKDNKTGYKLYAGYNFNPNFGLEGGYTQLGKLTDSWVDGTDSGTNTFKARAIYAAATATLPLNEQFALFAKLGVAQTRVKGSFEENGVLDSTLSKSKTNALFGIGASFNITKELTVVAEYENYGKVTAEDVKLKTNLLSVGLRYAF